MAIFKHRLALVFHYIIRYHYSTEIILNCSWFLGCKIKLRLDPASFVTQSHWIVSLVTASILHGFCSMIPCIVLVVVKGDILFSPAENMIGSYMWEPPRTCERCRILPSPTVSYLSFLKDPSHSHPLFLLPSLHLGLPAPYCETPGNLGVEPWGGGGRSEERSDLSRA